MLWFDGIEHTRYYLPKVQKKDWNFRDWWEILFWSTYIKYIVIIGQKDDYTIGCLLDYNYFKENYKMIAIDLYKQ